MPDKDLFDVELRIKVSGLEERIQNLKSWREKVGTKRIFLKNLLETSPNPVFFKDREGVYRSCNDAFSEKILGLPKERIIGTSLFDLPEVIPPDLAEIYNAQDRALIRKPGTQFYESDVQCADGIRHHFFFIKTTVHDAQGEVAGICGIMLDISEEKKSDKRGK